MKRIKKADSKKYVKALCKYIETFRVEKEEQIGDLITYVASTSHGNVSISVDTDNNHCYSLFCKFSDVSAGKKLGLHPYNPWSGKYNAHLTGGVEEVVDTAICHLDCFIDIPTNLLLKNSLKTP